jgi:RNA polymerase sigma factor (TIGR02999 family)
MSEAILAQSTGEHGDPKAARQLLPLVYEELRKLAARRLADEAPGVTLQPTALVHEAYLRLVGDGDAQTWDGRGHFFAAAAEAMRRILIDEARRKQSLKRNARREAVDLDATAGAVVDEKLLVLDEALRRLESVDPVKAELVKLRFFAGLTMDQAAAALGISPSTADRAWAFARAWIRLEVDGPEGSRTGS